MARVLVLGEALIDIVHRPASKPVEFVGGSAANAAVALARLDHDVFFATALGDDDRGRRIADLLAGEDVQWATNPVALQETSTALATIAEDGSASYTFEITWRLNELDDLPEVAAIAVSSLGPILEPGDADVLAAVQSLGGPAVVQYDINLRPSITGTGPEVVEAVERMARMADIIKASDEDLEGLYPRDSEEVGARRLLAMGPKAVVVTRGGEGAAWYADDRVVTAHSDEVQVADTIGAGDTFGAAILDALLSGGYADRLDELSDEQIHNVLRWASRAAGINVSREGANPPTRAEIESLTS